MVDLTKKQIEALLAEDRAKRRGFELIGQFIFWFSQLEFTIKARLAAALSLPDEQFDTITAPYDFAVLCMVTSSVLVRKFPESKPEIETLFSQCRSLNDERVRVAHGMWTHGKDGLMARHVSRTKLEPKYFYENPAELRKLAAQAQQLMNLMFSTPAKPDTGSVERLSVEILRPVRGDRRKAKKSPFRKQRKSKSSES